MDYFEEVYIGSSISDSFEILSKSDNTMCVSIIIDLTKNCQKE